MLSLLFFNVQSTWLYTFHYSYNNGAYAKLATSHLWFDILRFVKKAATKASLTEMVDSKVPRFILYSGHDTTLMPLLSSLGIWDGKWAPYASMWNMELYHIDEPHLEYPSAKAFRMIFNGKVLTDQITGCNSDLCDLDILLKIVEPLTTLNLSCEIDPAKEGKMNDARISLQDRLAVNREYTAIYVAVFSLFSFILGALMMRYVGLSGDTDVSASALSSINKHKAKCECLVLETRSELSYGSIEGDLFAHE